MPILEEIPGALERPSGCRIQVWRSGDDRETILRIPPRDAPLWMLIALGLLLVNLLLVLVTGAALLFAHHSILFMAEIAPGDLPLPMRRYEVWLAFGWGVLMALGFAFFAVMLRPLVQRETIIVSPRGITRERQVWRRRSHEEMPLESVRGFHLERDPQRLEPSVLTIRGRGEEWTIAESVGEADREWLVSVGNALLREL